MARKRGPMPAMLDNFQQRLERVEGRKKMFLLFRLSTSKLDREIERLKARIENIHIKHK